MADQRSEPTKTYSYLFLNDRLDILNAHSLQLTGLPPFSTALCGAVVIFSGFYIYNLGYFVAVVNYGLARLWIPTLVIFSKREVEHQELHNTLNEHGFYENLNGKAKRTKKKTRFVGVILMINETTMMIVFETNLSPPKGENSGLRLKF